MIRMGENISEERAYNDGICNGKAYNAGCDGRLDAGTDAAHTRGEHNERSDVALQSTVTAKKSEKN
jgi:hypothetical protein